MDKRVEFLRHARQADQQAERTDDPQIKDAWKRIAVSYLELARQLAPKTH